MNMQASDDTLAARRSQVVRAKRTMDVRDAKVARRIKRLRMSKSGIQASLRDFRGHYQITTSIQ